MKYKYKTKKLKYKLAKTKEKNKAKKFKSKQKSKCSKQKGKSQFVNVQKVSFKKVPVPMDIKTYKKMKKAGAGFPHIPQPEPEYSGAYGGGSYGGGSYGGGSYGSGLAIPESFPEPEVFPLPEPEITVNKKFVNYNYDYNDYSSNPGRVSTPSPTIIDYYEYEYENNGTRRAWIA